MIKKVLCTLGIAISIPGMVLGLIWCISGIPVKSELIKLGVFFLLVSLPLCFFSIKKLIQIDNNTIAYVYANAPKDSCICVFIGIVLGVMILCVLGFKASEAVNADTTNTYNNSPIQQYNADVYVPDNNYEQLTAVELVDEFKSNEIGANEKYNGKTIIVTGIIDDFTSTELFGENYSYIILNGSNTDFLLSENVQAVFEKKSEFVKLSKYTKGQEITIKGVCEGKSILNIIVNNCSVVE